MAEHGINKQNGIQNRECQCINFKFDSGHIFDGRWEEEDFAALIDLSALSLSHFLSVHLCRSLCHSLIFCSPTCCDGVRFSIPRIEIFQAFSLLLPLSLSPFLFQWQQSERERAQSSQKSENLSMFRVSVCVCLARTFEMTENCQMSHWVWKIASHFGCARCACVCA